LALRSIHAEHQKALEEIEGKLNKQLAINDRVQQEIEKYEKIEAEADQELLGLLRKLVSINESLKSQETEFRASCVREREKLTKLVEDFHVPDESDDDLKRVALIEKTHGEDTEKLTRVKNLLAKKRVDIVCATWQVLFA
jgi:predicted Fe-Mo cluster-binding NifX family protein